MKKLYSEEDIKKEFCMIPDSEFRDAVESLKFTSYLYGESFPEKEHLFNKKTINKYKKERAPVSPLDVLFSFDFSNCSI